MLRRCIHLGTWHKRQAIFFFSFEDLKDRRSLAGIRYDQQLGVSESDLMGLGLAGFALSLLAWVRSAWSFLFFRGEKDR